MPQLNGHAPSTGRRRGRPVGSDSAETRSRILRAARRVINERGYQAATFQAIAVTAELSRPTLHYYFASREEIFDALLVDAGGVMADCIAKAQRHESLVDQLSALVLALQEVDVRDPSAFAFLVSARLEASRNPDLRTDGSADLRGYLTTLVDAAVDRGELPVHVSAKSVVDLLDSMLWGMGFYAGFVDDSTNMREVTKQLGRVFSHGLLGPVTVS
jgi:AcrR family transcriptional regulator